MKRIWKRIGIGVFLLAGTLGLVAWVTLTWIMVRPPSYLPEQLHEVELRSWPEHYAIYQNTEFPYVLSIEGSSGALEYVGALHTSDAKHPQLAVIESRWKQFNPTIAFCEGKERMSRFASRPKTGDLTESRLVRILAYQNGVPLYSLEPRYAGEVAALLRSFEPKLVAIYMTLRTYTAEASGVPAAQHDQLALGLLKKRTSVKGLKKSLSTIDELDTYWNTNFSGEPDWRTLKNTEGVARLVKIGNVSREIRGKHMVSAIAELVDKGERVFGVVGASHVIRQELELRRLITVAAATTISMPSR